MVQGVRVGCFGCAWCAQVLGLWFENYPDRCCFVVGGLCFSDSNNIPWSSRGVFTKFHSKQSFLRRARCRLIIRRWRGCDVAAVELWQQYFFRKNCQDPATRCDWLIQARPLVTERVGGTRWVLVFQFPLWNGISISRCQAKFLICEIADFTPSAHAQSDIPGHPFRKRWLFTEISNILRTDDQCSGLGYSVCV